MADQLTALDATFLELEQADQGAHMHIGGVMVFDPLPDGGVPSLEELEWHLGERLERLPRYRQRLSKPRTGGWSWPQWEDDDRFAVAAHVREAMIPPPGGEEELLEWVGDFYSHRLDRSRPLWEMVLLEGLAEGRWALAWKTHHCMVDGVGAVDVSHVLLDPEPAPGPEPEQPSAEATSRRLSPAWLPRAPQTLWQAAGAGLGAARMGVQAALHPREALKRSEALAEVVVLEELMAAPRCSLNVPIGGRRRIAVVRASVEELRKIRSRLGGTLNDVVLAAATGALRTLLLARGETPPAGGLRAMVPLNVRGADEHADLGNRILSLFARLPVAESDPLHRYRRVAEETASLKTGAQARGAGALMTLSGLAPPILHATFARSAFATRLFNVTITNVPGPQLPLYALGARMREVIPLVPLFAEHAVGIAIISYDGGLVFGINADHETVPDGDALAAGMEREFAALHALVHHGAVRES